MTTREPASTGTAVDDDIGREKRLRMYRMLPSWEGPGSG
jgi:hypothetical protein